MASAPHALADLSANCISQRTFIKFPLSKGFSKKLSKKLSKGLSKKLFQGTISKKFSKGLSKGLSNGVYLSESNSEVSK